MIIPINIKDNAYDIVLLKGALNNLDKYLDLSKKALILTDSGVPSQYSKKVASYFKNANIHVIKKGEKSKNFNNYKKIVSKLIKLNFTRNDCVIAVGGGVVGDLAGFVASTYMRGIDFYNIPTTLLSQIDSSIGGKVAVDFLTIKNVVGAFYQPKKVIIDTEVLKTLPIRQFNSGLVESIKMSATHNKNLFNLIKSQKITADNVDKIVEESLKIKKEVVESDPTEKGYRKVLNFGHTLGHAIESLNFKKLYHGECVGLGMLAISPLNVKAEIEEVLRKYDLPTKVKYHNVKDILLHDKKAKNGKISCVIVEEIGSFKFVDLTIDELQSKMEG